MQRTRHTIGVIAAAATAVFSFTAPARAVVQGIDVSTYQGAVNWTSVKNAGIQFAFCKATEGINFVDARFTQNMSGASAAGVLIGPYHFARPDSFNTNPLDAANEANDFVDAIEPYYDSAGLFLRPVLDVEALPYADTIANIPANKAFLSEWIRDFSDVVETRLGTTPIIYCNGYYAHTFLETDIAQYDLWFAKPTNTNNYASAVAPTLANIGIWNSWRFWQWSWVGNIGGINPVDRDVFIGSMEQLSAFIPGFLPGDYNGDSNVDAADYTHWRNTLGQTVSPGSGADGNLSGTIDAGDYNVWRSKFSTTGSGSGAGAVAGVPEPATFVLFAGSIVALGVTSRRLFA
jgi:lysozyme